MSIMNRRQCLTSAATALACATNASLLGASLRLAPRNLKQSICAWCFTSRGAQWSLDELCEHAKLLGVPSVELIGPAQFATLKKHGLVCAITSTGLGFTKGFNNPAHRDELIEKTKTALEATAAAKFPNVIGFIGMKWRKPTDPTSGEIARDDAFKHCVEGLKQIAPVAESLGVNLCIEHLNSRDASDPMTGHPGYQGDDLDWMVEILKVVGSPRVKLLFDVYHVQIMHGDLLRRLEQCREYLGHIHAAGVPGRGELNEQQEINYTAVFDQLVKLNYTGYIGHEFIPTGDPLAGLKQAVELCRG